LRQLHRYGLLAGSFRPDDSVCVLRRYIRQRDTLIKSASTHIQQMQKALTQMNVQLHRVISDISGTTGLAIIRAIVAGKRDLHKLAALKDVRIHASAEEIVATLTDRAFGTGWRMPIATKWISRTARAISTDLVKQTSQPV